MKKLTITPSSNVSKYLDTDAIVQQLKLSLGWDHSEIKNIK